MLVNMKDDQDNTVLHLAAARKQIQMLKLFLESDVDVNAENIHGFTALDVLVHGPSEIGGMEISEILVNAGCDRRKKLTNKSKSIVKWARPPPGWIKLNVDGSSRGNPCVSGGGGVTRDSQGQVIFAFYRNYGHASKTTVETQAILDGIILCSKLGLSSIVVESDSKLVVEAAVDPFAHCHWNIWYRLGAIHCIGSRLNLCFRHIFCKGNYVADTLAKRASEGCANSLFLSCSELPRYIRSPLVLDKVGLGYLRA
ncbi:uncharacterized protein LOC131249355 [Magnolia sinica]|uniref:uncharacterized protein LOC131249355 n=1 Tax=Magnolia sinica TaxID=86752 RepID=UPI0026587F6C|nr:uncharacterized protein LOC131249355 [Magnolia sinica]